MSFEMKWTIVAGILCIILAYLWGLQYGYKRGLADGKYEAIMQYIEMRAKLQIKEDKDAKL